MHLISPDYEVAAEGVAAPFEGGYQYIQGHPNFPSEAVVSRMSPPSSPAPQVVSTTTTTPVSHDQENIHLPSPGIVRPDSDRRNQTTCPGTNSSSACECDSTKDSTTEKDNKNSCALCRCAQATNPRKRKLVESSVDESDVLTHRQVSLEKYKRLLLTRKRLLSHLAQRNNVPLFYLYGDLLLIPKYKWGSEGAGLGGLRSDGAGLEGLRSDGAGLGGLRSDEAGLGELRSDGAGLGDLRRTSLNDTDPPSPLDSGLNLEASYHHPHPRSSTSSLVQLCPDSRSLEENGFSPTWITDILALVMQDLNRYGVCVVDNFLGIDKADPILHEVEALQDRGLFEDGQVVSPNVQDQARGIIRGDKITWVTGNEPHCRNIRRLVSAVDNIVAKANHHQDAGQLANYSITWRSRAMVACYPGQGARYVKHVDNPDGDGRCITAIYYINKGWTPEGGGVLRIYPEGNSQVAEIEPLFDRMLFFWSDRRNPHEVLPANVMRYAITLWYYDQKEREEYLSRASSSTAST